MLKEVETRRSIRKYSGKPIEEEKLFSLLESARLAPSGSNTQVGYPDESPKPRPRKGLEDILHDEFW